MPAASPSSSDQESLAKKKTRRNLHSKCSKVNAELSLGQLYWGYHRGRVRNCFIGNFFCDDQKTELGAESPKFKFYIGHQLHLQLWTNHLIHLHQSSLYTTGVIIAIYCTRGLWSFSSRADWKCCTLPSVCVSFVWIFLRIFFWLGGGRRSRNQNPFCKMKCFCFMSMNMFSFSCRKKNQERKEDKHGQI